jgi:Fe-S oxidoreductase
VEDVTRLSACGGFPLPYAARMRIAALVVCLLVTVVAVALVVRAVMQMLAVIRLGQPVAGRTDRPAQRLLTVTRETLGHTRMLKKKGVGLAHLLVFFGFWSLIGTLVEAYGELFSPDFDLWFIGKSTWYGVFVDFIGITTILGIIALIIVRQVKHPRRLGRNSRFWGSTFWQAYYVEATILVIGICILLLRTIEAVGDGDTKWHPKYWLSWNLHGLFDGLSHDNLEHVAVVIITIKILASMAWAITISLNITMGVAWHRFLAFFNIYFKRNATGAPSLGPLLPMMSAGRPIDFEDPGEDDVFGLGKIEDLTWKGFLDVNTCTECGRCQEQCPAWNTDKPLSPKLLVLGLRDHGYAKAPWLQTPEALREGLSAELQAEAARPLVGTAEEHGVIDPDVLWSCTNCGACVQQCPVDIEHVDHIDDMRRYQVMIESQFPSELNGLFKNLENKGNPWGMNSSGRNAWIEEVDFPVRVFGAEGEDKLPADVDWLLWVGCAGAFEDRAKKTIKATAELLTMAGVNFMVLGEGETCTGDPARRSGNEFLFQMLGQGNVEMLNEIGAKKIVTTCPHCLNTLGREYPQLGGHYEVVHHTQLLNRLVKEKKLTPVSRVEERVTYHDPCFLGRHNGVYSPPRELIGSLPGLTLTEMPRNSEKSFCCGAGGARMWMEEKIGKRINMERTEEAVATGADKVAVGCPFCRVMISDGVTTKQQEGGAEDVEVMDVAQLLLRSVKNGEPPAPADEHVHEPAPVG